MLVHQRVKAQMDDLGESVQEEKHDVMYIHLDKL